MWSYGLFVTFIQRLLNFFSKFPLFIPIFVLSALQYFPFFFMWSILDLSISNICKMKYECYLLGGIGWQTDSSDPSGHCGIPSQTWLTGTHEPSTRHINWCEPHILGNLQFSSSSPSLQSFTSSHTHDDKMHFPKKKKIIN